MKSFGPPPIICFCVGDPRMNMRKFYKKKYKYTIIFPILVSKQPTKTKLNYIIRKILSFKCYTKKKVKGGTILLF